MPHDSYEPELVAVQMHRTAAGKVHPFPDLDCVHWLDAYEPESNAAHASELDDRSAVLSGEAA